MFLKYITTLALILFCLTSVGAKNYRLILDNHIETISKNVSNLLEDIEVVNLSRDKNINKVMSVILLFENNDEFISNPIGEKLNLSQNELNLIVQVIQDLKISKGQLDKIVNLSYSQNISMDTKKWLNRIQPVRKDMKRYMELKMGSGVCVFSYGDTYEDAMEKLGLLAGKYYSTLKNDEESDRFILAQCYCKGFQCSGQIQEL